MLGPDDAEKCELAMDPKFAGAFGYVTVWRMTLPGDVDVLPENPKFGRQ